MKRKMASIFVACFVASLLLNATPPELKAEEVFVTIGSGGFSGVYFPVGLAIANMINDKRHLYEIRATVESTPGSIFNLNGILAGYLEFGLAQADKVYHAFNGQEEWAEKGPQKELRSVFSVHHEAVTLVAAVDTGIKSVEDLKGKKVNLANPRSGQHDNALDVLRAVGLDWNMDILPHGVNTFEAPSFLMDNVIDAFFCTVGHPSEAIQMALSGKRRVRIVPISGPAIDKLIADKGFYSRVTIPVRRLYPEMEDPADVTTFGVIATMCTSSGVPAEIVYSFTKEIFENLDGFRRRHPALFHLTKEGMLEGLTAPIHAGALKYFKEAGFMK